MSDEAVYAAVAYSPIFFEVNMSSFKTITNNGRIISSIKGELRVLAEKDRWKQKVELWLLNDETNNNDWRYERLEEHRKLFAETPILVAYVGREIGDGHNFDEIRTKDGDIVASFLSATAERIVGFFKDESDIRIEAKNGKKWVVGTGWIWKWYAQELVAKLKEQGLRGMSVSIETLIDEMHKDNSTEVFTKYQILGTTILGDDVNPAVSGANIRTLSALGVDKIRETTLRVASEQEQKISAKKRIKENKTTMKVKDLQNKSFDGFRVCGVQGNRVALLSKENGNAFLSTADDENGKVIEGLKSACNATITFGEGEEALTVALDAVIDEMNAEISKLTNELQESQDQKTAVEKALKVMQDTEMERRRHAVRDSIDKRFEEIKKDSEVEFVGDECDELITEERIAEYIGMVDKNGKFIGDEKARCDVDAKCMARILENGRAKQNMARKTLAWDIPKASGKQAASDVETAIADLIE